MTHLDQIHINHSFLTEIHQILQYYVKKYNRWIQSARHSQEKKNCVHQEQRPLLKGRPNLPRQVWKLANTTALLSTVASFEQLYVGTFLACLAHRKLRTWVPSPSCADANGRPRGLKMLAFCFVLFSRFVLRTMVTASVDIRGLFCAVKLRLRT